MLPFLLQASLVSGVSVDVVRLHAVRTVKLQHTVVTSLTQN